MSYNEQHRQICRIAPLLLPKMSQSASGAPLAQIAPDHPQARPPQRPLLKWLTVLVLLMASVHFARCYVTLGRHYIDFGLYTAGRERVPFQQRMLMMSVLRWAEHNQLIQRFSAHRAGALNSPYLVVIMLTAMVSIIASAALVTWMYLRASRYRLFWWMPAALLLLIGFVQYVLHSDYNFIYPYDLPALLFFTAGLALIYLRRYWWLLPLFPIAALNRETIVFLIPLLLLDACCSDDRLEWRRALRPSVLTLTVALSVIWIAVQVYTHHRFQANPAEPPGDFPENLKELANPRYWPQFFSIGAFLPAFLIAGRSRIRDFRIRMYLWIVVPWLAAVLVYGMIMETRVFGELSALLALACTLAIEDKIAALNRTTSLETNHTEPVS